MTFLNVFKHLLPRGRAWSLTIEKRLRQFFQGLTGLGDDVKTFFDNTWLDLFPETTRELGTWEQQFAITGGGLTEAERRSRLLGAWRAVGGQDPRYIQDTLRAAGFDVYIHEWWAPSDEPPVGVQVDVTPRDPRLYLRDSSTIIVPGMFAGAPAAYAGRPEALAGRSPSVPLGYPLVNKVVAVIPRALTAAGRNDMYAGREEAHAGRTEGFEIVQRAYRIPDEPQYWHYFMYVGGETFPELANIPLERRDEFERLILKIRPLHLWVGVLANYV